VFKWVLLTAFLLSVLVCAGSDFHAQRTLEKRRVLVAEKRAELHTMNDIYQEVRAFQKTKDALQVRIDAINSLKQNQKTAAGAVATLSTVDATSIESAAVIDAKSLVVNTPTGARTLR
jgi:hypothetical protein